MPAHLPAPTPSLRRRGRMPRAALVTLFALLLACVVALSAGSALGETKSEQLSNVRDRQAGVDAELQASNGEVNALIGQVSELRQQEAAADAELQAKEEELSNATNDLEAGRAKLEKLRKQFEAASGELEQMLVRMYKSPTPDLGSVLLNSSDVEDYETAKQYYDRLQEYQSSVINRAHDLKDAMETTVERLAEDKQRIADARDAIAARRDELASQRADLEAQEAQLQAARESRRQLLVSLSNREGNLEDSIQAQAAREAAQAAAQAGTTDTSTATPSAPPAAAPVSGQTAVLNSDGSASPPAGAPDAVINAINAANAIRDTPYVWGGGHGSFESSGYDCSGAVSFALHGGGLLDTPLDSTGLMSWGDEGPGQWITVYANSGHAFMTIAGLRWDTSQTGGDGPSWSTAMVDTSAYVARHPSGL